MINPIMFYVLAAVLIIAALGVITSRNPVYSAMLLVLSFVTSAALWVMLEAEFLGIALVLVYVGAVMVLFLFVVMMLDVNVEVVRGGMTRYTPLGILVALAVFGEIVFVVWQKRFGDTTFVTPPPKDADYSNTEALGAVLYTEYVYAFELAAVILLLAIVAAIMLTMRKRPGLKQQDIGAQVAVDARDRVRLVKMKSESDQ
jgi:NADH-quinone oxidoreductase subunit J